MIEYLHDEYKQLLMLLHKQKVNYLLIGGVAVNIYGYHRATGDVDILYENSDDNILKLKIVIEELGYDLDHLNEHNFRSPTHLRLGEAPTSIDLINQTKGIDYDQVFSNAKEVVFDNTTLRVIDINDLIRNKKALNTFKDLADAEALEQILKKPGS